MRRHVMRSSTVFMAMVAAAALQARHLRCLAFTRHRLLAPPISRNTIVSPRTSTGLSIIRRSLSLDMTTRYQISVVSRDDDKNWIKISLSDADDTTREFNTRKRIQTDIARETEQQQQPASDAITSIPESVLQFERQMRKMAASNRASKTNVTIEDHLITLYADEHVVVTNKPSGILCVPGVNKYRSLLDLVYETYGGGKIEKEQNPIENANQEDITSVAGHPQEDMLQKDSMIVHRLDMDTSGIVVFARTRLGMSKLHEAFRERTGTKKMYEALLVGWLDINAWISAVKDEQNNAGDGVGTETINKSTSTDLGGGEINLPLQRDHKHPPFMRVSTPASEAEAQQAVKDLNHNGWKKIVAKRPKPSTTHFQILSHEMWMGRHRVTRVALTPITGRTHQLRVHCAALGHPILGDPAYGYCGEAHPNGGFPDELIMQMSPTSASIELRREVEKSVRDSGRTMCLHAKKLDFNHPTTGEFVSFEAAPSF